MPGLRDQEKFSSDKITVVSFGLACALTACTHGINWAGLWIVFFTDLADLWASFVSPTSALCISRGFGDKTTT
jgi:hypothetical protein